MKKTEILVSIFGVLTFLVNILIIVESFIGGASSASQSVGFTESVISFIEVIVPSAKIDHEEFHAVVRKLVGHFLLFGLSGALTSLTLIFTTNSKDNKLWLFIVSLVSGLALAASSELIQYFIPGRYGLLTDILIDFGGFLFFALASFGIFLIVLHSQKKKESK